MIDKYEGADKEIIQKIQKIDSPSLKSKLIEVNSITNILLYDKEDKFHNEYKSIRGNYENNSFSLYKKISDVISGKIDPSELLCEEDYLKYSIKKDTSDLTKINNFKEIKDFWLIAIKNSDYFDLTNTEEKILHYLKSIHMELHENKIDLTIKYNFYENEYFKNEIIKKHYFYNTKNEKLERSEFDEIYWIKKIKRNTKENKNNKKKFFDMFDKEKVTNDLDENEANFMKNDFLPGILGYYMNFIENNSDSEDNKIQTFNLGKINIKTIK